MNDAMEVMDGARYQSNSKEYGISLKFLEFRNQFGNVVLDLIR